MLVAVHLRVFTLVLAITAQVALVLVADADVTLEVVPVVLSKCISVTIWIDIQTGLKEHFMYRDGLKSGP